MLERGMGGNGRPVDGSTSWKALMLYDSDCGMRMEVASGRGRAVGQEACEP